MKTHRWADIKQGKMSAERLARVEARADATLLEMDLKELREMAGKTQAELASLSGIAQSELSKTERRDDHLISTVRRYVEALGGELKVIATIGDKSIKLHGI